MGGAWHAVDGEGRDPATGRPPAGLGAPSPVAALARVPVATWPLRVAGGDGSVLAVGEALGPGGARVERMLGRLAASPRPLGASAVTALARATPAGLVELPVEVVELAAGVRAARAVDQGWMGVVDSRRSAPRAVLVAQGREPDLEAALNLAMLVATGQVDHGDEAVRVASGARLWLLAGAVAWALLDDPADPFAAWGELVSHGLWPVGPADGRLVLCQPAVDGSPVAATTAGTEE